MSRRITITLCTLLFLGGGIVQAAHAQIQQATAVIFENVRILNGTADRLSEPSNVLVVGNAIRSISKEPIVAPVGTTPTRIQGGGRTLMPRRGDR